MFTGPSGVLWSHTWGEYIGWESFMAWWDLGARICGVCWSCIQALICIEGVRCNSIWG